MNQWERRRGAISAAVLVSVVTWALAGCGGGDGGDGSSASTIKLSVNNWLASELDTEIARSIMVDEMGLDVEAVEEDANAQFARIARGELHACLEVWGSSREDKIEEFVEPGLVENGGELGVVGKIGWFTPEYMVDRYPELETWEGLEDPEIIDALSVPATGDQGRFLGAVEGYSTKDPQIIDNLGLNLEEVTPESESEALMQLVEAYEREEPFLMYWWLPHSIHAKYDLHNVELPEHTDECYAKADEGGVACDYPTDRLFKIFWPGLKNAAPDAYAFLKNMELSTRDQIEMMGAVEYEDKSVEEAVADWLAENESTWREWIP